MPFVYNKCTVFLSVALHLPRPLSKECIGLAKQLEKAAAGSDKHAVLLAQLKQHAAWNEWVKVAQTYFMMQEKALSPRLLFLYWRDYLFRKLNDDAHRDQYDAIEYTIKKKKAGQEYNTINILALINSLGNLHRHPYDPQAGNDDGIDAIALLEEEDNEDADDDEEGSDDDDDDDDVMDIIDVMNHFQSTLALSRPPMIPKCLWDGDYENHPADDDEEEEEEEGEEEEAEESDEEEEEEAEESDGEEAEESNEDWDWDWDGNYQPPCLP